MPAAVAMVIHAGLPFTMFGPGLEIGLPGLTFHLLARGNSVFLFFQLFLEVFAPLHCIVVFLPEMRTKSPTKKNAQIGNRLFCKRHCAIEQDENVSLQCDEKLDVNIVGQIVQSAEIFFDAKSESIERRKVRRDGMRKSQVFVEVCRINGHEILADQDFGIFYYPVLHHPFDNILVKNILVLPQAHNLNNRFKLCHDCRRDRFCS